jgi:hypothetical protein
MRALCILACGGSLGAPACGAPKNSHSMRHPEYVDVFLQTFLGVRRVTDGEVRLFFHSCAVLFHDTSFNFIGRSVSTPPCAFKLHYAIHQTNLRAPSHRCLASFALCFGNLFVSSSCLHRLIEH